MKRNLLFLLVIVLLFQTFSFSVLAGDTQTGILAELEGATVGGVPFDMDDYPKKSGAPAELFAFMERGYRYDGNQSDYQMIVYIYNPSEIAIVANGKNTVQMAVKFDENGVADGYEKFNLKFIEKTENNRFYKFAVMDHVSAHDGNKIVQRVDRAARRYTVSGFEVQYIGASNGTESPVGKSFVFTGFQSEKNLTVATGLVETIKLDVHQTYWRSETSTLGEGHQNQLTSVYFAVPNSYFDKYGVLQAVKAGWNEQKTAPVVVVDNKTVADGLYSQIGISDSAIDNGTGYGFYHKEISLQGITSCNCIYNADTPLLSVQGNKIDPLGYAFYDKEITVADIGVPGEDLKKHIQDKNYVDWLFWSTVDKGRTKGYQEQTIYADELLDLKSYGVSHDWFATWLKYTLKGVEVYKEYEDIPPIYEVIESDVASSKTDAVISDSLYVAEHDVSALRSAYTSAVNADSKLMLFRFAATDYYHEDLTHFFENGKKVDCNGYIAQETVFLGFDVIALTFFQNGVSTVIPVVSDSQDVVPDITSPNLSDDKTDWSWVKRLVMMIAALVLLVICWKPLLTVIDAVMDLFHNANVDIQNLMKDRGKRK